MSDKIRMAFMNTASALGDSIIFKKAYEAMVSLAPECRVDIFSYTPHDAEYARAIYGESKNLENIFLLAKYVDYFERMKEYDFAVRPYFFMFLDWVNVERMQRLAPKLMQAIYKLDAYNKKYVGDGQQAEELFLKYATRSRITGVNCYTVMSCDGALPIYDNQVTIGLLPEFEEKWRRLGLKKYITFDANSGGLDFTKHNVKEWLPEYYAQYFKLMKENFPDVEVVQIGRAGVDKIENADRYFFGESLELVKHILKNAVFHIGCEGGNVHLATQLGTKCIVLCGPSEIAYLCYKQNINIRSTVCSPCMFAWESPYSCLRNEYPPPCMATIRPHDVFEITRQYLNSLK